MMDNYGIHKHTGRPAHVEVLEYLDEREETSDYLIDLLGRVVRHALTGGDQSALDEAVAMLNPDATGST